VVVEEGMVVVVVVIDTFCGCRSSLFSVGVAVVLRWSHVNQTIIRSHGTSPLHGVRKVRRYRRVKIEGVASRSVDQ
jgi:hypothetical protein